MYMSLFLLRGNFNAKIKRLFPIHHRFLLVIEEPSFQGGKVTHSSGYTFPNVQLVNQKRQNGS